MAERKVLIIDDDEALAPMLNTAFKRYSFKVLTTNDGADGLEMGRKEKPDLVLISVELPVGNGFLVCKEFKQDAELKDIPIIITSRKATDADFDKHRKLKVRANDYLHKPFTDEELFAKVGNVVGFALSPDEFSELEAKVHDFLEIRGKLESEIVEKSDRISHLEDELAAARTAATGSKADTAALKAKDKQIAENEKQIAAKDGELAEKDERITALEAELEGLQERAEESVTLESRVKELEKELAQSEDQLSEKEANFSGEIAGLQDQNNRLGKQVAALMEAKDKFEAELGEMRASIETLESDAGVAFEELGENIRSWKEAADSVGELNEGNEKLTRQLSALQEKFDTLNEEVEALRETEEKLAMAQASLEDAQTRASDAEAHVAELQHTVEREGKKRTKLKEVLEKALAAIE